MSCNSNHLESDPLSNQALPLLNEVLHSVFTLTIGIATYCFARKIYFVTIQSIYPQHTLKLTKNAFFLRRWWCIIAAWAAPNTGNYRESLLIIVVRSLRSLFFYDGKGLGDRLGGQNVKCWQENVFTSYYLSVSPSRCAVDQKCSPDLSQAVSVWTKPFTVKTGKNPWIQISIFLPPCPC